MSGAVESIRLADAVQAVRDGLLAAAARGVGHPVGFIVGPVEMEFTVEVREDNGTKGGFTAWVANAEHQRSRGTTGLHTVRFVLTPKNTQTGGDLLISADDDANLDDFFSGTP